MTPPVISEHAQAAWQSVVRADTAARESLRTFLVQSSPERVELVRQALAKPGSDRAAAMRVLSCLTMDERKALFPDLVRLASWAHGSVQAARSAISELPRDWVLSRIESVAEPILEASDEQSQFEEYRRFMELYHQLGDRSLLRRLAERALKHEDEGVREAGQEFLSRSV